MYLWKGWSWSLMTALAASTVSTTVQQHYQNSREQINIINFIRNLKEISQTARSDTNILFREIKSNKNNVEVLTQQFDFYTHKIDRLDIEINANFKDIFEDEHVAKQSKYDISSYLIELLGQRIDVLNAIIVELRDSEKPKFATTIQTKIEKLNETLADLNTKKMSLDLDDIVNWNAFSRHLDQLIIATDNQLEILENLNLSNIVRVEKFKDLNDQIHNQDKELKNIVLEYLQPQGQSWSNNNMLKHAKIIYEKASQNYKKRIETLKKMTSFLEKSNIFGLDDGRILQKMITQTSNFLKENSVEYDKLFKKIKEDIDKIIVKDQDQLDLEIVNKVAQSFKVNQQFRNGKILIYRNNQGWKVGDKIALQDLEIEEPMIEELSLVKVDYEITEISTQHSNRYVKVKTLITKNKAAKEISLEITNFYTKEEIPYRWLNEKLKYIADVNETSFKNDFVSIATDDDTGEGLGIHNTLSNYVYRITGLDYLQYEVIERDYLNGVVQAKVTVGREGKTVSKIIKVTGFKTYKEEMDRFYGALKQHNQYNPMSLDFKISLSNTWNDVINLVKKRFSNNFSSTFINAIEWRSNDSYKLDSKIYNVNEKNGMVYKTVFLEIYGYKLPKITLYFNNIDKKYTMLDTTLVGSIGNKRSAIISKHSHEEKSFVLIEKFNQKFKSWCDFSNRYKKITFRNFWFIARAMNKNSNPNTELVGTNGSKDIFELNQESLGGNPFPIYQRGYNDSNAQQQFGIFFELHVNDQDQLTIKFVLNQSSWTQESLVYLYLSLGRVEFS